MFIIKREMFVVFSGVARFFDAPRRTNAMAAQKKSYEIKKKKSQ